MHIGLGAYFELALQYDLDIRSASEYSTGLTITVDYETNVVYSPQYPQGLVVANAVPSFTRHDPSIKATGGM